MRGTGRGLGLRGTKWPLPCCMLLLHTAPLRWACEAAPWTAPGTYAAPEPPPLRQRADSYFTRCEEQGGLPAGPQPPPGSKAPAGSSTAGQRKAGGEADAALLPQQQPSTGPSRRAGVVIGQAAQGLDSEAGLRACLAKSGQVRSDQITSRRRHCRAGHCHRPPLRSKSIQVRSDQALDRRSHRGAVIAGHAIVIALLGAGKRSHAQHDGHIAHRALAL